MKEKDNSTMSRSNIIDLIACGKIKEEDVELTEDEKKVLEKRRKTNQLLREAGLPISWSTPID